jgi:cytochrome c oxidase subunit II
LRYPASGDWTSRLAKLAALPLLGLIIAACTEQVNSNPTGDSAAPNLFGETANGIGFPHEVVTTQGIAAAGLYLPVFIIAVIVFVFVEGWLLLNVLRFRRRSTGDDLPEQVHGNNRLEILWTAVPMVIVFVLFVVSTNVLMNKVEAKSVEHAAVVDVQAFRFGWIFDYQDPTSFDAQAGTYQPAGVTVTGGGKEAAPEMTLPVGEPVLIRLTAADVIHSWYVPSFFFKRDAIPGRINEFELTIEKPGTYGGQCAEFCGLAHSTMYFSVNAVSPEEYESWLAQQSGGAVQAGVESEAVDSAIGEAEAGTGTTTDTNTEAGAQPASDATSEPAASEEADATSETTEEAD